MSSSLPAARAIDFLCEHTSSKSRVMALLAHDNGPSSLNAVLTCKDPDHAFEAVGLLRRVLARRDVTAVDDELKALTAEMPDAPAGSLRQAVLQAASGTWPTQPGTLFVVPDPDPSEDETASDVPSGPVEHPRLKDLPGKVVRIAHLYEFHVTDEDALLLAAVDRGWEPLPASELGDDDPRDLIGAVMTLTEDPDVAGTQTLEEQSSAELLSVEDGDELADWSAAPIVTRFTHGWRLRSRRTRPAAEDQTPNFAALFTTRHCPCMGEDEDCEDCVWQLTPRTADLLHTALVVLADQAYDDAQHLGDQFLADADSSTWGSSTECLRSHGQPTTAGGVGWRAPSTTWPPTLPRKLAQPHLHRGGDGPAPGHRRRPDLPRRPPCRGQPQRPPGTRGRLRLGQLLRPDVPGPRCPHALPLQVHRHRGP